MFSLYEIYKKSDCVFPIDNQALLNVVEQIENPNKQKLVKENITGPADSIKSQIKQGS